MRLKFKDSQLLLNYLQIKLKEQYNSKIKVNSSYYTVFNNNYGFAHFIAKYLNAVYPPMDTQAYSEDVDDIEFDKVRPLTECISIFNYFLCDNNGNKLTNDLIQSYPVTPNDNSIFQKIYGTDICAIYDIFDQPLITPDYPKEGTVSPYSAPLTKRIQSAGMQDTITKIAKSERIYKLESWNSEKGICEIDDLVASYLVGRTITPKSSMEDIYYVQTLLLGNKIAVKDRGIWNSDSGNLTQLLIEYQRQRVDRYSTKPIFVTGYFDIYTEAELLKDRGEYRNGIIGI